MEPSLRSVVLDLSPCFMNFERRHRFVDWVMLQQEQLTIFCHRNKEELGIYWSPSLLTGMGYLLSSFVTTHVDMAYGISYFWGQKNEQ